MPQGPGETIKAAIAGLGALSGAWEGIKLLRKAYMRVFGRDDTDAAAPAPVVQNVLINISVAGPEIADRNPDILRSVISANAPNLIKAFTHSEIDLRSHIPLTHHLEMNRVIDFRTVLGGQKLVTPNDIFWMSREMNTSIVRSLKFDGLDPDAGDLDQILAPLSKIEGGLIFRRIPKSNIHIPKTDANDLSTALEDTSSSLMM